MESQGSRPAVLSLTRRASHWLLGSGRGCGTLGHLLPKEPLGTMEGGAQVEPRTEDWRPRMGPTATEGPGGFWRGPQGTIVQRERGLTQTPPRSRDRQELCGQVRQAGCLLHAALFLLQERVGGGHGLILGEGVVSEPWGDGGTKSEVWWAGAPGGGQGGWVGLTLQHHHSEGDPEQLDGRVHPLAANGQLVDVLHRLAAEGGRPVHRQRLAVGVWGQTEGAAETGQLRQGQGGSGADSETEPRQAGSALSPSCCPSAALG